MKTPFFAKRQAAIVIREALGLSTKQLGKRVRIDQSRISRLENAEIKNDLKLSSLNRSYPRTKNKKPFHNNGRHARLMSDILLIDVFNLTAYTWGSDNLTDASKTRKLYIEALKATDNRDYSLLSDFVRS